MKQITFLREYGEWIFRVLVLSGLVANLWLTNNFITRTEYISNNAIIKAIADTESKSVRLDFSTFVKDNTAAHAQIQSSIADIVTAIKLLSSNQLRIDDHEIRLRTVEKNQIDVMARMAMERK